MNAEQKAYLERSFQRIRSEAIAMGQTAINRVQAQNTAKGALMSGATLIMVSNEYSNLAAVAVEKIVRLAHEVTGSTAPDVCEVLAAGLERLIEALSHDLTEYFRVRATWAPANAVMAAGGEFLAKQELRVAGAVDDYRFGIHGGSRLTKDPLVSVVTSVTNSPGAVTLSGIANVQHVLTSTEVAEARAALVRFLQSPQVQALSSESKQSVLDVADVLDAELIKSPPDMPKVKRWWQRLVDVGQAVGVGVATAVLTRLFVGG